MVETRLRRLEKMALDMAMVVNAVLEIWMKEKLANLEKEKEFIEHHEESLYYLFDSMSRDAHIFFKN